MRLLLVSDLHYRLPHYDWVAAAAHRFDAVVIAGDHVDISSIVPAAVQIAALQATLAAIARDRPLFACSGNHDLDTRDPHGEKTAGWLRAMREPGLAVDGDSVQVDAGTLVTVCPWWDGDHARAGVARLLQEAAHARAGRRWIWVYHAPPDGPLSWTGKRHFGDPLLPELVERHQPDAVLCGHIHQAPHKSGGSWIHRIGRTWLFNAGTQIGDVPARIEIDFAQGSARWITMEGEEERLLAAAQ